eukprot:gene25020-31425_t
MAFRQDQRQQPVAENQTTQLDLNLIGTAKQPSHDQDASTNTLCPTNTMTLIITAEESDDEYFLPETRVDDCDVLMVLSFPAMISDTTKNHPLRQPLENERSATAAASESSPTANASLLEVPNDICSAMPSSSPSPSPTFFTPQMERDFESAFDELFADDNDDGGGGGGGGEFVITVETVTTTNFTVDEGQVPLPELEELNVCESIAMNTVTVEDSNEVVVCIPVDRTLPQNVMTVSDTVRSSSVCNSAEPERVGRKRARESAKEVVCCSEVASSAVEVTQEKVDSSSLHCENTDDAAHALLSFAATEATTTQSASESTDPPSTVTTSHSTGVPSHKKSTSAGASATNDSEMDTMLSAVLAVCSQLSPPPDIISADTKLRAIRAERRASATPAVVDVYVMAVDESENSDKKANSTSIANCAEHDTQSATSNPSTQLSAPQKESKSGSTVKTVSSKQDKKVTPPTVTRPHITKSAQFFVWFERAMMDGIRTTVIHKRDFEALSIRVHASGNVTVKTGQSGAKHKGSTWECIFAYCYKTCIRDAVNSVRDSILNVEAVDEMSVFKRKYEEELGGVYDLMKHFLWCDLVGNAIHCRVTLASPPTTTTITKSLPLRLKRDHYFNATTEDAVRRMSLKDLHTLDNLLVVTVRDQMIRKWERWSEEK